MKLCLMKRISKKKFSKRIRKTLRIASLSLAGIFLFLLVFSFTSGPFWIYYWLGSKNLETSNKPEAIILLSGGGMPSEDGIYRVYCAAKAAAKYKDIPVIISMPGDTSDTYSSILLTQEEMIFRGVDSSRVLMANTGTNTRSQALEVATLFPDLLSKPVLIVTAPIHLRRAVLTFEKAGFEHVSGYPTFERIIESNLSFDDKDLGGNKFIPDVGDSINLRYRFWGHLKLEVDILRELFALGYYWLKGWI